MYELIQGGTGNKAVFRNRYRIMDSLEEKLEEKLEQVMVRCFHAHVFAKDEDGTNWCYTDADAETFHKLVQRARCEMLSDEKDVCFMAYDEYMDLEFRTYFMEFLETNGKRPLVPMGNAATDANQ